MIYRRDISPLPHQGEYPFKFRPHRGLPFTHNHLIVSTDHPESGMVPAEPKYVYTGLSL